MAGPAYYADGYVADGAINQPDALAVEIATDDIFGARSVALVFVVEITLIVTDTVDVPA